MSPVDADPAARYPRSVVLLHWSVALLILASLSIGWYMVDIPRSTPERAFYFNLHKSLGVVTAIFIVALIVFRLRLASPPLPAGMPKWERFSALLNHRLFYLFMVLVTVTGYCTSSFSKYGPKLFGIALPHWGWEDAALRSHFVVAHRATSLVFAVLIVIHIGAALKHLLLDKDRVFERMT